MKLGAGRDQKHKTTYGQVKPAFVKSKFYSRRKAELYKRQGFSSRRQKLCQPRQKAKGRDGIPVKTRHITFNRTDR